MNEPGQASHLKLVEPIASPFEGEVMDFLILALWGAGQNTTYIASSFGIDEWMIAERMPVLLKGRKAFREAVSA